MIIYKYLRKEHLLKFKVDGSIIVNTLYGLREIEHEPLRDELEGRHSVKISSDKKPIVRFSGKEFHTMIPVLKMNEQQEKKITVDIEKDAKFDMQIANAFVFCTSLKLDDSLGRRFGYDAYYKITDPFIFANILFEKLNEVVTMKCFRLGAVKYADKPVIITDSNKRRILGELENPFWSACFTKPRKYSDELEYRMVFVPEFAREIKPIIITCPELRKCCAF